MAARRRVEEEECSIAGEVGSGGGGDSGDVFLGDQIPLIYYLNLAKCG